MKRIFLLLLACAIPIVIFALPIAGFENTLKKIDWYSPFYIFTLQLGLGALLFVKLSKDFAKWIKDVWQSNAKRDSKSILIILSILIIGALAICIFWIEGRSRVQMDESIYLVTAQNLYYNQTGTICDHGVFANGYFECVNATTIKPRGLSYLYMLGMPILGTDLRWVYNFQVFLLFLTLPLFFLAILAWTKNQWVSLLATALLANCPALLILSRSASIEGLYVLMLALSLLFLKWACDRNTIRHWLLLALTLSFFAQTRSETVFCLFAFIGAVFYKNKFSILNSQFSIFLTTLSFFSLPILCTLSLNRDSNLQGGSYGARGHLLGNIITDFKIMAFPYYNSEGLFVFPYFPYFAWFALFGLITLIVLTIKEFRSKSPTLYKRISAFLLLLTPQYLILFDSVSADLNLDVQQRFALVILPAMSFLGALFIWQMLALLKNRVNPKILLSAVLAVISINTLLHNESFKRNILFKNNTQMAEYSEIQKFLLNNPAKNMIFFTLTPIQLLDHGISAYNYDLLFNIDENVLEDLLKIYNGNVFVAENSTCKHTNSIPKMITGVSYRICDRAISYFNTDTLLNVNLVENTQKNLVILKILSLNDRDPKGFLRILDKIEPTDSTVQIFYKVPKDTAFPWQIKHFVNDSFLFNSPYAHGNHVDYLKISQFNRDTNIWRLDIIDTIANEKIHSDFWQLVKVKGR